MTNIINLYEQFQSLVNTRFNIENTWRECYEFALPQKEGMFGMSNSTSDRLFDGTAPDCVDQLAAFMLSELTPAWKKWFHLSIPEPIPDEQQDAVSGTLTKVASTLQSHFDQSAFVVEIHQCFLDLVTAGTACLLFEESDPGSVSAFKFTAVPISQIFVKEGKNGNLNTTFRKLTLKTDEIKMRYGHIPTHLAKDREQNISVDVIEAIVPSSKGGFDYTAFIDSSSTDLLSKEDTCLLATGHFTTNPYLTFRWVKAPGEMYGRSPVMKALPDIKTANKVVELILKNATIAVTGIWQAEDDGVLNPANIRLVPGAIIPKAVGSKGLVPLQAAGNFDVSQIILEDLRGRIRRALLTDKLGLPNETKMTATEVMERSADMSRVLGATYGRLQNELLNPLMTRAVAILRRRGEIPDILIDGRLIKVQYESPIARKQSSEEALAAMNWIENIARLGDAGLACINVPEFVRWLASSSYIPLHLLTNGTQS